jgi:hypothetical protein
MIPDWIVGSPNAPSLIGMLTQAGRAQIYTGPNGTALIPLGGLSGAAASDHFGMAVAGSVDTDGDGVKEVIIGIPDADPNGSASGRVVVVETTGLTVLTLDGLAAGDTFGEVVAVIGDVTGDGKDDFAVGAPLRDVGGGNAGEVRVYSGGNGMLLQTLNGTTSDQFGSAIAGAGDVNNDGTNDFAVGSPFDDAVGATDSGSVTVYNGAGPTVIWVAFGSVASDHFGTSVAGVGDLNGDGNDDFVGGAPDADPGGSVSGQAVVFSGASGLPLLVLNGPEASTEFGESVANMGDLDGDGVPDIAVGARTADPPGAPGDCGTVTIFSGGTGNILSLIRGLAAGDHFGERIAVVGDVNGDGQSDLLVGAPDADPGAASAGLAVVFKETYLPPSGTGCAGSGGFTPRIRADGWGPCINTSVFGVTIDRALGSSPAQLVFGAFLFAPPLNLDPIIGSTGGCSLYVLPDGFISLATLGAGAGQGTVSVGASIPNMPVLVGASIHFQWYVVDPGPFPIPGTLTPYLTVTLM